MKKFLSEKAGLTLNISLGLLVFGVICVFHLLSPKTMHEPDSWSYYFAAENFSEGSFVVDSATHEAQVNYAESQGGDLINYLQFSEPTWEEHHWQDMWYFEKSPGYPMLLSGWHKFGISSFFPIVLGLAVTLVLIFVGHVMFDKRGFLLPLFFWANPLMMIMFHRVYMAMFASVAFLTTGAGLTLVYCFKRGNFSRRMSVALLLLAGTTLGISVLIRHSNVLIVLLIGGYLIFTVRRDKLRTLAVISWLTPIIWALVGFATYNTLLFGSPFDYGYKYSPFITTFATRYLFTDPGKFASTVTTNLRLISYYLVAGFPVLMLGILSMFFSTKHSKRKETRSLKVSLSILTLAWLVVGVGYYIPYEWTALNYDVAIGTVRMAMLTRFYLPIAFPVAVVVTHGLQRIPRSLKIVMIILIMLFSGLSYWQYVRAVSTPGLVEDYAKTQRDIRRERQIAPPPPGKEDKEREEE